MANHIGRMQAGGVKMEPPREVPRIKWATIVHSDAGWHLATIVTQGTRVVEQHLGRAETFRPVVEAEWRRWTMDNVLDRDANA